MLLKLIGLYKNNDNATQFDSLLKNIKEAFWPSIWLEKNKDRLADELPSSQTPLTSDEAIRTIEEHIKKIVTSIDSNENTFYTAYHKDDSISHHEFPFTEHFFGYFVQRKYSIPYRDPASNINHLFRLDREEEYEKNLHADEYQKYNYSKNYGDYNHFINVIIATARIIEYFSNPENLAKILKRQTSNYYTSTLAYNKLAKITSNNNTKGYKDNKKRIILLMLSAFYHDLGKTIVYPRHAMEGSILIANHTKRPVYLLDQITSKTYGFNFNDEDLIYVSNLVYYHDQYGTLGTGEAGYLRLVDLLYRLKRFAYRDSPRGDTNKRKELERKIALQCIFDLWVLNLADTMVSINGNKFDLQENLFNEKESQKSIKNLLEKKGPRIHDLLVTFSLVDPLFTKHHSDDLSRVKSEALTYSRRHTIERIYRLIRAIIVDHATHYTNHKDLKNLSSVKKILSNICKIAESDWHAIIGRSIIFVSDFSEFVNRFAWVGQLDYSFSFFEKIARRALVHVGNELDNNKNEKTKPLMSYSGWTYQSDHGDYSGRFIDTANAKTFAENFTTILVQILHHLLFREKEFDRLINFEFRDAADRLTNEKIDRIISIEGPYRAKHAVQLALEGIFFFK